MHSVIEDCVGEDGTFGRGRSECVISWVRMKEFTTQKGLRRHLTLIMVP